MFLLRVGQEAHLDEYCGHVGTDEDAERRLLQGAGTHRHAIAQRRLHRVGEPRRLLEVIRLRHLPRRDLDLARAAADDRQGLGAALRRALRLVAVAFETQREHFRARHCRTHRGVRVDADEQIRLVVVGQRGALIRGHGLVAVARQQHAHAEPRFE